MGYSTVAVTVASALVSIAVLIYAWPLVLLLLALGLVYSVIYWIKERHRASRRR